MLEFKIRGGDLPKQPMVCWLEKDGEGDMAFVVSRCGTAQKVFTLMKDGTGYLHHYVAKDIGLTVENGRLVVK